MSFINRWRSIPYDVTAALVVSSGYLLSLVVLVLDGPGLAGGVACLTAPFLFGANLFLISRAWGGAAILPRLLPFLLTSGCIVIFLSGAPLHCADLHVMRRIYLAGGPYELNDWAQELIQHYPGYGKIVDSQSDTDVPPEIRQQLGSYISVYGKPEQIPPVLRIELGGGFFHFGIFIVSSASAPKPEWWQRQINWPSEVIIYHED